MSDRIPTLAEVCSAIADGSILATLDGSTYEVKAYELRRYLNKFRLLPTISSTTQQILSSHTESSNWSASAQTSVA
jgi:hypothetical protein